ncbi:hypothetical protein TNCV_3881241 [Trichonephila clavipes]|nr:hypothetical protein TNCV_3881241 [Trichonephila clavipes]
MALRQFLMNKTSETSGSSLIVAVLYNIFITGSQLETKLVYPYFKNLIIYQSPMMFISSGFHPMLTSLETNKRIPMAKEGCNASPPISSTLTYSEHQSRVKSEILRSGEARPTITGMKANIQDPHSYLNVAEPLRLQSLD